MICFSASSRNSCRQLCQRLSHEFLPKLCIFLDIPSNISSKDTFKYFSSDCIMIIFKTFFRIISLAFQHQFFLKMRKRFFQDKVLSKILDFFHNSSEKSSEHSLRNSLKRFPSIFLVLLHEYLQKSSFDFFRNDFWIFLLGFSYELPKGIRVKICSWIPSEVHSEIHWAILPGIHSDFSEKLPDFTWRHCSFLFFRIIVQVREIIQTMNTMWRGSRVISSDVTPLNFDWNHKINTYLSMENIIIILPQ